MLKAEAIAQVDYISTMARLDKQLLHKTYKLHAGGATPGMSVVFNKADELCRQNPTFQSSLVVSLLKAAVAKATSPKGSNAKTDVQVFNFIRLIATYDKKASQVVSANLGGPGDRWVRKINAKEQKDCIILRVVKTMKRLGKGWRPPSNGERKRARQWRFILLLMQQRSLKSWRCRMLMDQSWKIICWDGCQTQACYCKELC